MPFNTIVNEKDCIHQNILEYDKKILSEKEKEIYTFGDDNEYYFSLNNSEYNFIKWVMDNSFLAEWFSYPHSISYKINTISF